MNNYIIVRNALDTVACPKHGVIIDVVHLTNSVYAYRIYRDNLSDYSDADVETIYSWLRERSRFAERMSTATVGIEVLNEQ